MSYLQTNYKEDKVCNTKHIESLVITYTSPPDFIYKGDKTIHLTSEIKYFKTICNNLNTVFRPKNQRKITKIFKCTIN